MAESKKSGAGGVDQIVAALIDVRSKCETIPKSGTNKFHGYNYATESDIAAHISPLMDAAGLVLIPSVAGTSDGFPSPHIDEQGVTQAVLKYTLAHVSGQVWPEPLYVVAQGNDRDSKGSYGDKGAYKANTGGFKYMLLRLLMVETGDDPEGSGDPASPRQPKRESRTEDPEPKQVGRGAPASSSAGRPATDKQKKFLTAKCYVRAKELTGENDEHNLAKRIGDTARKFLGIEDVQSSDVDMLVAVIAKVYFVDDETLGVDGKMEDF